MDENTPKSRNKTLDVQLDSDLFFGDFAAYVPERAGDATEYGRVVSNTGNWVCLEYFGFPKCVSGYPKNRCVRASLRPYNFREATELVGKTLVRLDFDEKGSLVPVDRLLVHRVSLFRANGEAFVRINRADCENSVPEDDAAMLLDKAFLIEPYLTPCGVCEVVDSNIPILRTQDRVQRYFSLFGGTPPSAATTEGGGPR